MDERHFCKFWLVLVLEMVNGGWVMQPTFERGPSPEDDGVPIPLMAHTARHNARYAAEELAAQFPEKRFIVCEAQESFYADHPKWEYTL